MKKSWISIFAAVLLTSSLTLTSCGGNNGDMPPETTEGNTRETGIDGTGDLPGTGTSDTLTTQATGTDTDSAGVIDKNPLNNTTGSTTGGTTSGNTTH